MTTLGQDDWMLYAACRRPDAPEMVNVVTTAQFAEAVRCCHQCPVLTECHRWLDELPEDLRPVGVVAGTSLGRKNGHPTTHTGRPRHNGTRML